MPETFHYGRVRWGVQRFLCCVVRGLFWLLFGLRQVGRPPSGGTYIIAPNHTSYMDPMLIQLLLPRHVTFMMDAGIFRVRLMNWFFKFWGAIPVSTTGRSAAGAMKTALGAARGGELLGVFPEGRISLDGKLQEGRGGVSVLMQRAGVPVVPVAIIGAFEVLPKSARFPRFGTIKVVWGEPIHVSVNNTFDRREAADELRNQVMGAIKDLQDLHRKP